MRTNIVIDDKLMKETLRLTGLKTKREAVELGLRTVGSYDGVVGWMALPWTCVIAVVYWLHPSICRQSG